MLKSSSDLHTIFSRFIPVKPYNNTLICHRCNIAVILLTDLIIDHSVKVEWGSYLHLLLHAIFIGNKYLTLIPSFYVCVITERQYDLTKFQRVCFCVFSVPFPRHFSL